MSTGVVRGLRIGIVLACLGALTASDAQTSVPLKEAKLKGIEGTKQILDWAPTSAKAGVAVMCDDDLDRECGPGIALLKPTGKSKPFQYLGHSDARAALAWPGGGYAARRPAGRAKATGVVVLVARGEEDLVLYTGQVKKTGKLKGALKRQTVLSPDAYNAGGNGAVPPLVRAAMFGDRVGVVVVFQDGTWPYPVQVRFLELNGKGTMIGGPTELTFTGPADDVEVAPLDLVGDGGGWHVLASHDGGATERGRLLAWTLPIGAARARVAAQTVAETSLPPGSTGSRYGGSFVRDLEPLTVFYDEAIGWETDVARERGIATTEVTRYLTELGAGSRTARREVTVQVWDKPGEIWNMGASSTPFLVETTSNAVSRGRDHVFAIGRGAHRNITGQASWQEPQREYSIYSLDPGTGQAELLARTVRDDRAGGFNPILARRFGSKTTILFDWDDTLAYIDRVLLSTF